MDEHQIKHLVRGWRQRSHEEGDQFASFVFIWFCFNAWLEHVSTQETDAGMIDELARRTANMWTLYEAYDAAFAEEQGLLRRGLASLVAITQEEPLHDVRGRRPDIRITDVSDFANVVKAIYRIRCNLFHGGKVIDNQRDQVLVRNAAMVLREWIGRLITTWD